MRLVGHTEFDRTCPPSDARRMPTEAPPSEAEALAWPAEADLILSAMEAAAPADDRRARERSSYRTRAELRLFSTMPLLDPTPLYSRDLHASGLGFITRERLPLGYGGLVEFTAPDGRQLSVPCTVKRCREAVNGWFEGALQFTREQAVEVLP
jgi:hypothetical protein